VRRADRTAGELGRGVATGRVEEVGGLAGAVEQVVAAGEPVMDARRGQEMAETIRLKLERIAERPGVGVALLLADLQAGVQVTVGPLGRADRGDRFVDGRGEVR